MDNIYIKKEILDNDTEDDEDEDEDMRRRTKRKRDKKMKKSHSDFTFISCSLPSNNEEYDEDEDEEEEEEDDEDIGDDDDDEDFINDDDDDYDSDEPLSKKIIKKIKTEYKTKIKKEPKYKANSLHKKKKLKRNRKKLTLRMKLDIIKRFESGDRPTDISNSLDIPKSTIRTIIRDADKIKEFSKKAVSMNSICLVKNNRNFLMIEMETELIQWIKQQNLKGLHSNMVAIQSKAIEIFDRLKSESSNPEDEFASFKASSGWFDRFKRRAEADDVTGKQKSERSLMMRALTDNTMLKKIIDEGGYTPHQIFSADEIGLFWKRFPLVMASSKEASMYRSTLDRFSLLLCSNASGNFKLKPLVVYQSVVPKCMKGVKVEMLPVIYKTNKKALITAGVFEDWFYTHFCPSISSYLKQNNLPMKALLILDSAPCHPPNIAEQHKDVKVFILPPNCSSSLQPFEQGIWTHFKLQYHRCLFKEAAISLESELYSSFKSFWLEYSAKMAIETIAKVWDKMTAGDLNRSWKNLWPECVQDSNSADNEAELNAAREEIISLGNKIGYNTLDTKIINELLDSHNQECSFQELKDMEYEKLVLETYNETRKEQQRILTAKSIKRAIQHFENAMALLNEHDPVKERCANLHAIVNYAISCYQDLYQDPDPTKSNFNVQTNEDNPTFFAPDLEAGCSSTSLLS